MNFDARFLPALSIFVAVKSSRNANRCFDSIRIIRIIQRVACSAEVLLHDSALTHTQGMDTREEPEKILHIK